MRIAILQKSYQGAAGSALPPAASGCGPLPPALLPAASGCSKLAFDPSGYGLLHIDSGMKVTKVTVSEATLFKRGPEMDSCI